MYGKNLTVSDLGGTVYTIGAGNAVTLPISKSRRTKMPISSAQSSVLVVQCPQEGTPWFLENFKT